MLSRFKKHSSIIRFLFIFLFSVAFSISLFAVKVQAIWYEPWTWDGNPFDGIFESGWNGPIEEMPDTEENTSLPGYDDDGIGTAQPDNSVDQSVSIPEPNSQGISLSDISTQPAACDTYFDYLAFGGFFDDYGICGWHDFWRADSQGSLDKFSISTPSYQNGAWQSEDFTTTLVTQPAVLPETGFTFKLDVTDLDQGSCNIQTVSETGNRDVLSPDATHITNETTTFTAECFKNNGLPVSKSIKVTIDIAERPLVDLWADIDNVGTDLGKNEKDSTVKDVPAGSNLTLHYDITAAGNCTLNGAKITPAGSSQTFSNLQSDQSWTLFCTGIGNTVSESDHLIVKVIPNQPPEVKPEIKYLKANNEDKDTITVDKDSTVTLAWDSVNASYCRFADDAQDIRRSAKGIREAKVSQTTTFSLTCANAKEASEAKSVTVNISSTDNQENQTLKIETVDKDSRGAVPNTKVTITKKDDPNFAKTVTTDNTGGITLKGSDLPPAGTYNLSATATKDSKNYQGELKDQELKGSDATTRWVVLMGEVNSPTVKATIIIKTIDSNNDPIPEAEINIRKSDWTSVKTVSTNSMGVVKLEDDNGLEAGTYSIAAVAKKDGKIYQGSIDTLITYNNTPIELTVIMKETELRKATIKTVDETGQLFKNAYVVVHSIDLGYYMDFDSARNATGLIELLDDEEKLLPGKYEFYASYTDKKGNIFRGQTDLTVQTNDLEVQVEILLKQEHYPEAKKVKIKVMGFSSDDPLGKPIEGAQVFTWIDNKKIDLGKTGQNGYLNNSVSLPLGNYLFDSPSTEKYFSHTTELQLASSTPAIVEVVINKIHQSVSPNSVSGKVYTIEKGKRVYLPGLEVGLFKTKSRIDGDNWIIRWKNEGKDYACSKAATAALRDTSNNPGSEGSFYFRMPLEEQGNYDFIGKDEEFVAAVFAYGKPGVLGDGDCVYHFYGWSDVLKFTEPYGQSLNTDINIDNISLTSSYTVSFNIGERTANGIKALPSIVRIYDNNKLIDEKRTANGNTVKFNFSDKNVGKWYLARVYSIDDQKELVQTGFMVDPVEPNQMISLTVEGEEDGKPGCENHPQGEVNKFLFCGLEANRLYKDQSYATLWPKIAGKLEELKVYSSPLPAVEIDSSDINNATYSSGSGDECPSNDEAIIILTGLIEHEPEEELLNGTIVHEFGHLKDFRNGGYCNIASGQSAFSPILSQIDSNLTFSRLFYPLIEEGNYGDIPSHSTGNATETYAAIFHLTESNSAEFESRQKNFPSVLKELIKNLVGLVKYTGTIQ